MGIASKIRGMAPLALLAAACSSYDPSYDCAQTLACNQEQQKAGSMTQAECEKKSQALFDSLSSEQRGKLDATFERCREKRSCEYVSCVNPR